MDSSATSVAPALVLVPSSPLDSTTLITTPHSSPTRSISSPSSKSRPKSKSSKNSSPVSTASGDSSSYAYTTPPSSYGTPTPTTEVESSSSSSSAAGRDSSESAIFSIYSMYSERRQTWRKSSAAAAAFVTNNNVAGAALVGSEREHKSRGSRESGGVSATVEEGTGRPSESVEDSFDRARHRGSMSRQSSSGSGFFAGSGSGSGSGEGSSRHQSYSYTYSANSGASPSQSRTTSKHVNSFLDVGQNVHANIQEDVGTSGDIGARESTELAYANRDSLLPDDLPSTTHGDAITADTRASDCRRSSAVENAGNYVDLTLSEDSHSQPVHSFSNPVSIRQPASGQIHPAVDGSTNMLDGAKSPKSSPPNEAQAQSESQGHTKSESTSTATHYGFALSPSSTGHGVDSMSSTQEGYVTAPQSIESGIASYAASISTAAPAPAPADGSPPTRTPTVQRFRVMNPDPRRSPSPAPPPIDYASQRRVSSQKELPPNPSPKAFNDSNVPSVPVPAHEPTTPASAPTPAPTKRQSSVSSESTPSPGRGTTSSTHTTSSRTNTTTTTTTSSSSSSSRRSRGGVAPEAGEEPEAFFVRNTYAQLDVTGVKGDGYEEGVERTRAKLGHDRRSVQMAAVRGEAREEGQVKGEVAEEELKLLGTVDRYGFFDRPSHERVVVLSASLLSKPLHHVTATITSSPPSPPTLSSEPQPRPIPKELEKKRISKWGRMLEAEQRDCGGNVAIWRIRPSKEKKLCSRVFKGIPDAWRAAAWEVLVARFAKNKKKRSLDARSLENTLNDLRREYRSSLDRPSSYDVQIDLDVPRTISGHVLFKTRYGQGQRSLFHTLHSFSLVCKECGYCQGMGPLAATLLCYYEPEKVYSFLVRFHDDYGMHDTFLPGFPGLLEAIYVQERIMERMLPAVYASFKKHMIATTSYATKWYITLFANTVPFQTQLRIWDAFLLEGRDVFVVVAVAIVWVLRDHITSNQANFETVLSLLSSFFVPEDEDVLLKWIDRALDDKKLRADMGRWRTEWQGLVREKKDNGVLLGM